MYTKILLVLLVLLSLNSFALNGFDLSNSSIPVGQIRHGGPPKDGIPALDNPKFISAQEAQYLSDKARVLGVYINGVAKAYPVNILNYHEIVNDAFQGKAVVVTYCPLCGTGVVFEARSKGQDLRFGVSGLLYNNDVLLYDRQSGSLWSQILAQAVTGSKKGQNLKMIVSYHGNWGDWRRRHPHTVVLSRRTGYNRDYSRSPYGNYDLENSIYFPVAHLDNRYHPKERVLGVEIDGKYKVYPFSELSKAALTGGLPINDSVAGRTIGIHFDQINARAWLVNKDGKVMPSIIGFWFAWMAFHPQSQVYRYRNK